MYNENEAQKAIAAKQAGDLGIKIALLTHKAACEWVELYGLPYRIIFDYLTGAEILQGLKLPKVEREPDPEKKYIIATKPTGETAEDGRPILSLIVPDEILEQETAEIKRRMGNREKAAFLTPYKDDIPGWTCFDIFGDTIHTEQETQEQKQCYITLIKTQEEKPRCRNH